MILRKIFISYLLNLKGFLSWMGDGQFSNISTLLIGRMKWGMFKYLMLEVQNARFPSINNSKSPQSLSQKITVIK